MAQYTLTTPRVVEAGDSIPFDNTIINGGCKIRHRSGSTNINLRGGCFCCPRKYRVLFNGTVTGNAVEESFAIVLDGEELAETTMTVTPYVATNVWGISAATIISVDCECSAISVRNTSDVDVTVNTANIIVEEVM